MSRDATENRQRISMKDVAKEAGVSQSTVSFVLNGREEIRISDEARRRVLDAVDRLGYSRRAAGRPPKHAPHGVIGLMFDEVATSPFAMITIEGAQEQAWNNDLLLEVVMTGGDKDYEAAVLRKWANEQVLGVIYGAILTRNAEPPDGLINHRAVLVNCHDLSGRYPGIVPGERSGGIAATQALLAQGYRRIAFIAGDSWMEASCQRQEGYVQALKDAGLALDPNLMEEGNFLPSGGYDATLKLMRRDPRPEAIFCANDLMAVGCYEALKDLGLRVGQDVAVIGYDDQEIAQHLNPTLSSVLLPHREMGQWAVDQLLSDQPLTGSETEIPCPVVPRQSHLRTDAAS